MRRAAELGNAARGVGGAGSGAGHAGRKGSDVGAGGDEHVVDASAREVHHNGPCGEAMALGELKDAYGARG